jgi:hypothetical protein
VTLLRRAPREVYRVYAEDEFFACPEDPFADTERLERTRAPRAEKRRRILRKLAGSTLLLAVASALGGLAILAERSPSGPARRSYARELATSGAADRSRPARAQVWLARLSRSAASNPTRRQGGHGQPVRRTALAHGVLPAAARGTFARRVLAAAQGGPVPASTESTPAAVRVAAASVPAPEPGQAEFGFERAGHE